MSASAAWNALSASTSRLNIATFAKGGSNINQLRLQNSSDMTNSLATESVYQDTYSTSTQTFPVNNYPSSNLMNMDVDQGGLKDDATLDQSQLLQYQVFTDSNAGGPSSVAQRWPILLSIT